MQPSRLRSLPEVREQEREVELALQRVGLARAELLRPAREHLLVQPSRLRSLPKLLEQVREAVLQCSAYCMLRCC